MKSQDSKFDWFKGLDASFMASLLVLGTATAAHARHDGVPNQLHLANSAANRTERHEARAQRRDFMLENRVLRNNAASPVPTAATVGLGSQPRISNTAGSHHVHRNTAVLFPGQVSTFHTARPNQGGSTYINDGGRTRAVSHGVSLDLSSTHANITVGENLFDGNTTIQVGGQTRVLSAGSKVTAAEYAALNQKLATGTQALTLSSKGAAEGGSLNLNLVSDDGATIRASELVIPQNVSVTGDFARTADGVRVTRDVVNYGSLLATSTNENRNTAVIAARDIDNQQGGSISSLSSASNPQLNLALRADRDLSNSGTITSAGDLELSAGHSINNGTGSVAQANGSIVLNASATTNQGLVNSTNGDITFNTAGDANLWINNYGGTLNAANGEINIRNADYAGTGNSILYGGDLFSKEVNINAGQGTGDLIANEVTGAVNTTGLAAHVSTNTSDLILGTQCLTGDPTYYNTGNIILGGSVIVGEDLAIIAGGNITTTQTNLIIRTQDAGLNAYNINIIAGANITAGAGQVSPPGGPATLPAQFFPSVSQNATAPVTVSGASVSGGNIDFLFATTGTSIDATSFATNGKGGDITLAAFANAGGGNGKVLMNTAGPQSITASGAGTGANGNVNVFAGGTTGQAIQLGTINNNVGSGSGGDILVRNAQPGTSDGNPITFATNGSITSGNSIVAQGPLVGGSITVGTVQAGGSVTVSTTASVSAGTIDVNSNTFGFNASDVLIIGANVSVGTISASNTTISGGAGTIEIISNSATAFNLGGGGANGSGTLTANAGAALGDGGAIRITNTGTGGIFVSAVPSSTVADGDGADLSLDAGTGLLNIIAFGAAIARDGAGGIGNGGSITLTYGSVSNVAGLTLSVNGSGSGTGDGGTVDISAGLTGGVFPIGNISANGGSSGAGGDGGTVTVTALTNTGTFLNLNPISATGGGSSGGGGTISVTNTGTGGIQIDAGDYNVTAAGDGGHLSFDASPTESIIATAGLSLIADAGGAGFANGTIDLTAFNIATGGNTVLSTSNGLAGTGDITLNMQGGVFTNGNSFSASSGGNINLNLNNAFVSTAGPASGPLTIIAGGSVTGNAFLNASALTGNNNGNPITVLSGAAGSVTFGNIFSNGSGTGPGGPINLTAGAGGLTTGTISSQGSGTGPIVLSSTDSDINTGAISASTAAGPLIINLLGVTPGDATIPLATVSGINGIGGGTITISTGLNPLRLGGLGGTQSFVGTTNDTVVGVLVTSALNTTGTIDLNTTRFETASNINAASISVSSTGNLTVVGAAGNPVLTATTPPSGTPGNPSNPAAIVFSTGTGAFLNLFSNMTFNGDVALNNVGGTTTSNAGSIFNGNDNITLTTDLWVQTGNIFANNLIFAGGTIANTSGPVVLNSALFFTGRDLAIIALTDIDLQGGMLISTASATGDAGNVTLLAGYNFTPATGTQTAATTIPFAFSASQTSSGSILGTATIDTNATGATGNGGTLTAIANGGSVSLGNMNTGSINGTSGNVVLIGSTGVNVGNIQSNGATAGNVTLSVSTADVINGPSIVVQSGTVSGGSFLPGVTTNVGPLSVGAINASNADILLETLGSMTILGVLNGKRIELDGGNQSDIFLSNAVNTLTADTVAGGDGGFISIKADTIFVSGAVPLNLIATGTGVGDGGTIIVETAADLVVGVGGSATVTTNASAPGNGGRIELTSAGNINVTGGINAIGADGDGADIFLTAGTDGTGTLQLTNIGFLAQIDATGTNGSGGNLVLDSQLIALNSSAAAPQDLSADGNGTGNGGSVTFRIADPASSVYIGSPVKPPKGNVHFLTVSADSGTGAGADAGDIIVSSGGNLTVDTTAISATPGANGDGGAFFFTANNLTGKTGSLAILGNLDANGSGTGADGLIVLTSNSTKAFSIGGTKAPTNGVLGNLSGGVISVLNNRGGISVLTSNALTSNATSLNAGLKGGITAAANVVISSTNFLELITDAGSIGKKALSVSAPTLALDSTGGSVNVNSTFSGSVTLATGEAGKDFTLTTAQGLNVDQVTATDGSITLIAGTGTLNVAAGGDILATNGGIIISNSDTTTGAIVMGPGANIETAGKGDDVIIAIGAPPKKGSGPNTLTGFAVLTPTGKGNAFFGPNAAAGVVPTGPGLVTVTAKNKNVIFNNLSTGGGIILVGDLVTITADPPSKTPSLTVPFSFSSSSEITDASLRAMPSVVQQTPTINFDSSLIGLSNVNRLDNASIRTAALGGPLTSSSTGMDAGSTGTGGTTSSANSQYLSDSTRLLKTATVGDIALSTDGGINQLDVTNQSNDLLVNAAFHSDRDAGQQAFSLDKQGVQLSAVSSSVEETRPVGKRHVLSQGNVVFAPFSDMTVETPHGTIELAAGSIALVMQSAAGLAVYDLHDQSKNAVVVNTNNKRMCLSPGRHVMVSSHTAHDFDSVNPIELVQYRGINQLKLDNGWNVYTSEFSIPSACYAVKPLTSLMTSKHREAKSLASRLMKTTAVLMTLSPDHGDYVQFFKRQMTAMN